MKSIEWFSVRVDVVKSGGGQRKVAEKREEVVVVTCFFLPVVVASAQNVLVCYAKPYEAKGHVGY